MALFDIHYEQVSKWSRRGFFCFCLGIDCLSFGLGLDSVSTSPGLGLVLVSTKVDLTTALAVARILEISVLVSYVSVYKHYRHIA